MITRINKHIAALANDATAAQFIKFSTIGAVNTVLDFSVYVILTRTFAFWGSHIVLAATASFCLGVTSSFLFNTFWTFRAGTKRWYMRIGRFGTVAVVGLGLNAAILAGLTSLGMFDILAKAFATAMVLVWNFTMQKKWTFRA